MLSGCVGYVFGVYVGCYSRIDLSFVDPKTFVTDKPAIQKEAEKTLKQLDLTFSSVEQSRLNIEGWMSSRENLSETNCVAQWRLHGKRSFWWGDRDYSVQMFIEKDTVSFVIVADEQESQKKVKEIQAVLTKMIEDEFPNIKVNLTFRSLRTAMPP